MARVFPNRSLAIKKKLHIVSNYKLARVTHMACSMDEEHRSTHLFLDIRFEGVFILPPIFAPVSKLEAVTDATVA